MKRILAVVLTCAPAAFGDVITAPSQVPPSATLVDFELYDNGQEITVTIQGLRCRSESAGHIGFPDFTDRLDIYGRFDAPMIALSAQIGGGVPTSGVRYASGAVYLGQTTSDMRLDFPTPQAVVGLWLIDNDFSNVQLRAFDASGLLLESLIVPQVAEGGQTFRGFSRPAAEISYLIIDGPQGVNIDSTFIDDVVFAVPEPRVLAAVGLLLLPRRRRSAGLPAAPRAGGPEPDPCHDLRCSERRSCPVTIRTTFRSKPRKVVARHGRATLPPTSWSGHTPRSVRQKDSLSSGVLLPYCSIWPTIR